MESADGPRIGHATDGSKHDDCLAKYINHSCNPNCRADTWVYRGECRLKIVALKPIRAGDEVDIDYGVVPSESRLCFCNDSGCKYRPRDTQALGEI